MQQKERKGTKIWKEVKLPFFAGDMISYAENPKDAINILEGLIKEFSKNVDYEINTRIRYISIY